MRQASVAKVRGAKAQNAVANATTRPQARQHGDRMSWPQSTGSGVRIGLVLRAGAFTTAATGPRDRSAAARIGWMTVRLADGEVRCLLVFSSAFHGCANEEDLHIPGKSHIW